MLYNLILIQCHEAATLSVLQMRNMRLEEVQTVYPVCEVLDLVNGETGVRIQSPAPQSYTMPFLAVTRIAKFFEQLLSTGILLSTLQHTFI